jgi:hypothetical protein
MLQSHDKIDKSGKNLCAKKVEIGHGFGARSFNLLSILSTRKNMSNGEIWVREAHFAHFVWRGSDPSGQKLVGQRTSGYWVVSWTQQKFLKKDRN